MELNNASTNMSVQQTTVVVQGAVQHGGSTTMAAPQNVRPFSTNLFGCFEDCGGCLFAYFLFPCYLCGLATRLSESCCVPIFLQGGMMAMRTKLRVMYGIQGSLCDDWLCTACCPELAACQLDREMKNCGL